MCRSRSRLSWRDILNLGVYEHSSAEVAAQKPRRDKVDGPAHNAQQLFVHREELEAKIVSGVEFFGHVHVAIWAKIIAQNQAEEREPAAAVMSSEEIANAFRRHFDSRVSHLSIP